MIIPLDRVNITLGSIFLFPIVVLIAVIIYEVRKYMKEMQK